MDRLHITETVAGHNGVVLVQLYFIVVVQSSGNTALRIFGRRLNQSVLGYNQDTARRREFNGRAQARNTSAHNDEICSNL
jgi:hypothetical protein